MADLLAPVHDAAMQRKTRSSARRGVRLGAIAVALAAACTSVPPAPAASPQQYADLQARLTREAYHGRVAGFVALVSRAGHTQLIRCELPESGEFEGWALAPGARLSQRDTIQWIESLSAAITCAAALTFVDEGRLGLDDMVALYLPEFDGLTVREGGVTSAPLRALRVEDLMTQTAGFHPELVRQQMRQNETWTTVEGALAAEVTQIEPREISWPVGVLQTGKTSRELARQLAALPLGREPGRSWSAGISADVLGVVLERISGQTLYEILQERIFEPLEMPDTAFHVPAAKTARLASILFTDTLGSAVPHFTALPPAFAKLPGAPPAHCSGSRGLYSTVDDMLHFCEMLAAGGERAGRRVLSEESVRKMTSNHLQASAWVQGWRDVQLGRKGGFGLGLGTPDYAPERYPAMRGSFLWSSESGASFFADPARELIGVYFGAPTGGVIFREGIRETLP